MTNIREIIEKALPDGHTLSKNDVSAIHSAVKDIVGKEYVPTDDYRKKMTENAELKTQVKEMSGEVSDGKSYKELYEAEKASKDAVQSEYDQFKADKQKELDDFKSGVESERLTAKKQDAIKKHLEKDGANPKLVNLLLKEFDLEKVELDGDAVKDWETVGGSVKENYADVFGEVTTKGVDVATPPMNTGGEPNPWKKDSRSIERQTAIYREDPARARQLAAEAGVKL